jgi:2,3-dihydroxybenzoate decarboxylase
MDAYYKDYAKDFPMVVRRLGLHRGDRDARDPHGAERRIRRLSQLKIVLGHLGETLPFLVWRVDQALARPGAAKPMSFRELFCGHFYITTSGNFSNPALLCCVMEMGIDRILFAVDWPFVANKPAVQWIDTMPLCDEDKIAADGNAQGCFVVARSAAVGRGGAVRRRYLSPGPRLAQRVGLRAVALRHVGCGVCDWAARCRGIGCGCA